MEHLLFVGKAVASGVIDKVPRVVREARAKLAIQRKKKIKELRRRRRTSALPVRNSLHSVLVRRLLSKSSCWVLLVACQLFLYLLSLLSKFMSKSEEEVPVEV